MAYVVAHSAIGGVPTTKSAYKFIDVSAIDVTGGVFSVRKRLGTQRILRAEDAACIAEAACERETWLNRTNAPVNEAWRMFAPSTVLSTNLISLADGFFTTKGRGLKSCQLITDQDPLICFVATNWIDSTSALSFVNVSSYDLPASSWFSTLPISLACALVYEGANPSLTDVSAISGSFAITADGMERLYNEACESRRLFCGGVELAKSATEKWDPIVSAVIKADETTFYSYSPNGELYTYTSYGFGFETSSVYNQLGRLWPYGWSETADPPKVIMHPSYSGKVKTATLYLALALMKIQQYSSAGAISDGRCTFGYIRVPLTKGSAMTYDGRACDSWSMPSEMCSSKHILADYFDGQFSVGGGFPFICNAYAFGGILDLEMLPDVDP